MKKEQQAVDELYKSCYGKMVRAMLHFSSDISLTQAEDIVQDAFLAALAHWEKNGIPHNAPGWLYTVCRNKAINMLRANKNFSNPFDLPDLIAETGQWDESSFGDEQLRLLFACAHPRLTAKVQVVITLKYVANLRVESIARALGMTIDGIDKLLLRARQKIKMENIFLQEPAPQALRSRLPIVHKILYLLFNEGYKASSGNKIIREDLCEESLLMTKSLFDAQLADPNTAALYSLMLFNAARLSSRFNAAGELADLEEQDRSRWNPDLIALGTHYLRQSRSETVSTYHYEATIAWLHCSASSFGQTDWPAISSLYTQLQHIHPNPFVELNGAIARYYAGQKTEAFRSLHKLQQTFLNEYYLLQAALGKLYWLEGDAIKGKEHLTRALSLTHFPAEREFIGKMMEKEPGL